MKRIIFIVLFFSFQQSLFSQDVITGGENSWVIKTPDDGRKELFIAPISDNGNPNWSKQTAFFNNGNVIFSSDLIFGGSNSWIFHTPDDGRTSLYIAPRVNDQPDWSKQTRFYQSGDVQINGNTRTKILTILGGSDIAEPFSISGIDSLESAPGSIVVIDESNPGKLKISQEKNDNKVLGVISGANGVNSGLVLNQENTFENGTNVAISGRVYVKANNSNGIIKPGDFLTTSNIAGEAMKVTDILESQGSIIGKAMTELDKETGFVLLFITLQ